MHLLVNCEREPKSDRRFARVGSFGYGAYGNESCMMVVDLDRRGYHKEAQECLDAWLALPGNGELPGSFASKDGVLYGAGGYESGGYNQHHGWILWMLAEHYRFTRDAAWLRRSAPGLLKACDWIIRETNARRIATSLNAACCPPAAWKTSATGGRGFRPVVTPGAAWILQLGPWNRFHIRTPRASGAKQMPTTRTSSPTFGRQQNGHPVVRLRDGTAIPHIPSHVHRRGRSFGWICETLEGALHLLDHGRARPAFARGDLDRAGLRGQPLSLQPIRLHAG